MKDPIYLIVIFSLLLSSCNKQTTGTQSAVPKSDVEYIFQGYSWGTDAAVIIADLGEPKLKQTFPQYGAVVDYLYFGTVIVHKFHTIYAYAFIDNKLVGGTYVFANPAYREIEHITGKTGTYIYLRERLIETYGDPGISPELYSAALDTAFKTLNITPTRAQRNELLNVMRYAGQRDLPDIIEHLSDDEFNALLPFQNLWTDNGTEIKLSLDFDEGYIVKIDYIGPEITRLTLPALAETIVTLFNDPDF